MSRVRKAVITAAGRGTRHFPATRTVQKELFPLVDRDGFTKPVLQIVAEEAMDSGVEQICIVCSPHSEGPIREQFAPVTGDLLRSLSSKPELREQLERLERLARMIDYVVQPTPEGYGDAVLCAREFVGDEPFLLLLGDHVYASHTRQRCSQVLLQAYERLQSPVTGVSRTPSDQLHLFGVVKGEAVGSRPPIYRVRDIGEKPSTETARAALRTPGLPINVHLALFGIHVLTPEVFGFLSDRKTRDEREAGEIQLTSSLADLMRHRDYYAVEIPGERLDMGVPEGYVHVQRVLAGLMEQKSEERSHETEEPLLRPHSTAVLHRSLLTSDV